MAALDLDLQSFVETQQILLAATHHDIERLRTIMKTVSPNVQDSDTLYTPLHAAIASCATDKKGTEAHEKPSEDGSEGISEASAKEQLAERTLKLLLLNGAIWNDLDANNETPGCLAWRLGMKCLYEVMVDAGVRAELLLNRLDAFQPLDEEEDEPREDLASYDMHAPALNENFTNDTPSIALQDLDDSSILSPNYLSSSLSITTDRILDSSANGVMMAWESELMKQSAALILPTRGLKVLNIGFGMGIVDSFIQENHATTAHHIIEAHPEVLENMKLKGWDASDVESYSKSNVTIHAGKWQTILPQLIEENQAFDAIYFDTFAEGYKEFRDFFSEYVIALLEPHGLWSFFHGLGADRQVCYDVYTKVCEMDLMGAGFEVDWIEFDTPQPDWNGVRRKYFNVEKYRLPVCRFMR